MPSFKYRGARIDEKSQTILRILRARGTDVTTRDLREHLGEDDNKIVTYRMNQHLGPAGLVAKSREEEWYSGLPPTALWSITDEGRRWLEEHDDEITNAVDLADALEEIQHVREGVDTFDERLKHLEEKFRRRTETLEDHVDRIRRNEKEKRKFGNAIGDLDSFQYHQDLEEDTLIDELRSLRSDVSSLDQDVASLEDKLPELEDRLQSVERSGKYRSKRLDELEEIIDVVDSDTTLADLADQIEKVDKRTSGENGLTTTISELQKRADKQEAEIKKLREEANKTIWDQVLPWRTE